MARCKRWGEHCALQALRRATGVMQARPEGRGCVPHDTDAGAGAGAGSGAGRASKRPQRQRRQSRTQAEQDAGRGKAAARRETKARQVKGGAGGAGVAPERSVARSRLVSRLSSLLTHWLTLHQTPSCPPVPRRRDRDLLPAARASSALAAQRRLRRPECGVGQSDRQQLQLVAHSSS